MRTPTIGRQPAALKRQRRRCRQALVQRRIAPVRGSRLACTHCALRQAVPDWLRPWAIHDPARALPRTPSRERCQHRQAAGARCDRSVPRAQQQSARRRFRSTATCGLHAASWLAHIRLAFRSSIKAERSGVAAHRSTITAVPVMRSRIVRPSRDERARASCEASGPAASHPHPPAGLTGLDW